MNYCDDIVINESWLNTHGTLGDSCFVNASYPSVSLNKGGQMKILTKKIKDQLVKNHNEQDGTKSFKAVLKLFNPTGIGTWYLSELDPETNNAYGLCCLHEKELGYVNIDELLEFKGRFGLGIERDLYFKSKTFDECRKGKNE
jgi:hypothetical protein